MAELYRHTDDAGDMAKIVAGGDSLMFVVYPRTGIVKGVELPDAAGRRLLAALQQHFGEAPATVNPELTVGGHCPCCGGTAPLTSFAVCASCTAELGWDPRCEACIAEDKGEEFRDDHIDTCRPGIGAANLRRAVERRRPHPGGTP